MSILTFECLLRVCYLVRSWRCRCKKHSFVCILASFVMYVCRLCAPTEYPHTDRSSTCMFEAFHSGCLAQDRVHRVLSLCLACTAHSCVNMARGISRGHVSSHTGYRKYVARNRGMALYMHGHAFTSTLARLGTTTLSRTSRCMSRSRWPLICRHGLFLRYGYTMACPCYGNLLQDTILAFGSVYGGTRTAPLAVVIYSVTRSSCGRQNWCTLACTRLCVGLLRLYLS